MIRITIDYLPHGLESSVEELAVIDVINNLSHKNRPDMGNYQVEVTKEGETKVVNVNNHTRDHGLAALLKMVFSKIKL